jgi:hypothetical protein
MATYSDPKTFRKTFLQVKDDEIYWRVMDRAAEMAYNMINSVLNSVYSVPFSPTPDLILDISDMLTKHFAAMMTAGMTRMDTAKEWETAVDWLNQLRAQKMDLPGVARLSTTSAEFFPGDYVQIFDVDSEYYQMPDDDLIDSILTDRLDS